MNKLTISLLAALALCFAFILIGCSAPNTNVTINTAGNKPAANTNTAANTTAPAANTETAKTETAPAGDITGVPECDEYIRKYEACLTTIAAKAPQAAPALKTSFEAQRNAFKQAASTPQGKAALAPQCTQAIATAKTSTAQWCSW